MDADGETHLRNAYQGIACEYYFGFASMTDVLVARSALANATLAKIAADLDLNLLRVALHRALLTDQFANIHGCTNPTIPGRRSRLTLDQACHEGGSAPESEALR